MIRISRQTSASVGPLPIRIVTNRTATTLNIPGPSASVQIPGDRIVALEIANPQLYGIRIVANDIEYRLSEVADLSSLPNVTAIIIFDGFLYGYPSVGAPFGGLGVIPGYTYRPEFIRGGELVQSGKSFLYPPQVVPLPPPAPCPPPPFFGPYPYGGYYGNPYNQYGLYRRDSDDLFEL